MSRSSTRSSRSLALALALASPAAAACPCGVGASPVTSVSSPGDRGAVRVGATAMADAATWDDRSRAWPTPDGVRTRRLVLELAGAWRPWRDVELSATAGAALTAADQPGVSVRAASLGDVTLRTRWDALDRLSWRGAISGAVRAPTGDAVAGGVANAVPGLGLGAWEFALGGELARRRHDLGEVGVAAEFGARLPSARAQGGEWWLGPRITVTAFGAWRVTREVTWSASVSNLWELDASLDGARVPGSGARRLTVSTGLSLRAGDHAIWSASLAADPWVDGLGANATATVRATLGATWVL